jgi:sigma-B regulation protein RsbU (phosphoserine phosphatase)
VRIGGCALAGYSEPADACGGEFWTCRALGAERVLLLAGDVLGAGVTSAVVAAGARGVVEGLTHDCPGLDPSQVLEAIHHALLDVAHGGWRMTCCVALFDRPAATLQLASAGHPAPYLLAGSSDEPRQLHRLLAGSTPLGQGTCRIESETRSLAGGEMLLFLGQGVTGRRGPDGERFGSGRLEALLTSPVWPRQAGAGRDALCEALDRFAAGTPLHDDLTLVVCQLEE